MKKIFFLILSFSSLFSTNFIKDNYLLHSNTQITEKNQQELFDCVRNICSELNLSIDKIEITGLSNFSIFPFFPCLFDYKIYFLELMPYIKNNVLYLNKEVVSNLSDEEIKGLIAVSIVDVNLHKFVALGIFFLTLIFEFKLFKSSSKLQRFLLKRFSPKNDYIDNFIGANTIVFGSLILPCLSSLFYLGFLEKLKDKKASNIVSKKVIINALCALGRLPKSRYEDFFESLNPNKKLDKTILFLTKLIRPYTTKERIDYVQRAT